MLNFKSLYSVRFCSYGLKYQLIFGLNHAVLLVSDDKLSSGFIPHLGGLFNYFYDLSDIHSLQASTHVDGVVHSDLCSGLRHAVGRDPAGHSIQHQKVSKH